MACLILRNLDAGAMAALRRRALRHHRSLSEEAWSILHHALLSANNHTDLAIAIQRRLRKTGGVDLPLTPRQPVRRPPDFA